MSETRIGCTQPNGTGRTDTICIDTYRVLDSCRDRDCYEDVRVYLTAEGQDIIDRTCTIRAIGASIVSVYIGIDEVPFNDGFYQLDLKFYLLLTFEACINGTTRPQTFEGIAVIEKKVVLWGGEGNVSIFRSTENATFCNNGTEVTRNFPIGVVETVSPIVLSDKVVDCATPCGCCFVGCTDIPDSVAILLDGELVDPEEGNRLYVSFGIFSVVRLERPGQYLVQASPYSVPDKECVTTDDHNPCSLFRTMAFPIDEFTPSGITIPDRGTPGRCCKDI